MTKAEAKTTLEVIEGKSAARPKRDKPADHEDSLDRLMDGMLKNDESADEEPMSPVQKLGPQLESQFDQYFKTKPREPERFYSQSAFDISRQLNYPQPQQQNEDETRLPFLTRETLRYQALWTKEVDS